MDEIQPERKGGLPMRMVCTLTLLFAACGSQQPQAEACHRYVACIGALDAARGGTTDLARFADSGDCWGSAGGAELCAGACERGLERMRTRVTGLPMECLP
jgi:hypothetical protein